MKCVLCSKNVLNNYVVKDRKAYHLKCLYEARDKQAVVKIARGEYYECNYCHKNCRDNHITYKGYWFHKLCLFEKVKQRLGVAQATDIVGSL